MLWGCVVAEREHSGLRDFFSDFFFLHFWKRAGLFDGDGKRGLGRERGENGFHVRGGLGLGVVSFRDLDFGQNFFQQRSEFKFGEELAEQSEIRLAGAHGLDVSAPRNVGVDGGHAFAEKNGVAIVSRDSR